ncbi:hypothetical protein CDAR_417031 [Caerostris darwini]|uniref:Uncharacterized protein n=1 Tax=Caerostris darwini TaxID=1538125 RepID=A0AAV4X6Y4_9ARAC|nr:hypothetical protein CDAR_417031 [Caerostris darwini]
MSWEVGSVGCREHHASDPFNDPSHRLPTRDAWDSDVISYTVCTIIELVEEIAQRCKGGTSNESVINGHFRQVLFNSSDSPKDVWFVTGDYRWKTTRTKRESAVIKARLQVRRQVSTIATEDRNVHSFQPIKTP